MDEICEFTNILWMKNLQNRLVFRRPNFLYILQIITYRAPIIGIVQMHVPVEIIGFEENL